MLKGLILFSNLILALIVNVIFGEGVQVTQNSPSQVNPGDEFIVELIINKTDVSGFAKIVQELPKGFTTEAIETQGASFTFNDNKVKLIWMALPTGNEFIIKYKITVGPDVEGKKTITGKFAYLYNNERKTIDLPVSEIMVGEEELVEETPTETEEETIVEETTPTILEPVMAEAVETTLEPVVEQIPLPIVSAERKVTDMGDGTFKVEININQNGIDGFAKAQEQLPSGATMANDIETKNSIFSYVDQQAKFVWMSVPKDDPIYISYTVTGNNLTAAELRNMDGNFAYLFNEETMKVKIIASEEQPQSIEPLVETVPEPIEPESVAKIEAEPIAETATEPIETEPIVEVTPEPIEETIPEPTTSIPEPQTGVLYKVQICAGHDPVNTDPYFKSAFSFSEGPIMLENHEGWIKYTIGGFDTYKTARERRSVVTAGYELPGPFVSAYNDGTRITVQEALMITNQQWIQ